MSSPLSAECVTFLRGSGPAARVWRYATVDVDVVLGGVTYRAAALSRGPIRRARESAKTDVDLTIAAATPCVRDWLALGAAPEAQLPIAVNVRRVSLDATGAPTGAGSDDGVVFVGVVAGLEVEGPAATIRCESLLGFLERDVPRIAIQRTCPWALYDARCGVDPAAVAAAATVTAVGSAAGGPLAELPVVTVQLAEAAGPAVPLIAAPPRLNRPPAPDLERFDGGQLVWGAGTPEDPVRRTAIVRADVSAWPTVACVVQTAPPAALVGALVTLLPACQKTFEVCYGRFGNGQRFGGFDQLPHRNVLREGLQ